MPEAPRQPQPPAAIPPGRSESGRSPSAVGSRSSCRACVPRRRRMSRPPPPRSSNSGGRRGRDRADRRRQPRPTLAPWPSIREPTTANLSVNSRKTTAWRRRSPPGSTRSAITPATSTTTSATALGRTRSASWSTSPASTNARSASASTAARSTRPGGPSYRGGRLDQPDAPTVRWSTVVCWTRWALRGIASR